MDLISPYRGFARWYRGNTHAHTDSSDGDTPVRGLIEAYEGRGYDFLAITDHNTVSDVPSAPTRRLLMLPSTEVTVRGRFHICALGVRDATELSTRPSSPHAAVAMIHRCGGLPILCHPEWSHLTADVILSLTDVSLVEIANAVCNRLEFNGFALGLWDRLLRSGRVVWGVAADDAHRGRYDIGKAWVVVNATTFSAVNIMANLKAGNFYSSMGPTIHSVHIDGRQIRVTTSPVIEGRFRGASEDPLKVLHGEGLSEFDYSVEGHEQYVRFECIDESGLGAWTNPILVPRD